MKRLLGHYTGYADVEISNLLKADAHSNIVRYFDTEEDEDFMYIAIEECAGNLQDFIKMANGEAVSASNSLDQRSTGSSPEKGKRDETMVRQKITESLEKRFKKISSRACLLSLLK